MGMIGEISLGHGILLAGVALLAFCCLALLRGRRRLLLACRNQEAILLLSRMDYFVLDESGAFVCAPRHEENWGRVDGRMLTPEEWILPEDLPPFRYQLQRMAAGRSSFMAITYRVKRDEQIRYYAFRAMPVRRRGEMRFLGTVQDVTLVRKREQEYNDTHHLLATMMDSLPCPIFTKEIDGAKRYLSVNKAFLALVDLPLEKVAHAGVEQVFPHRETAATLRQNDLDVIAANGEMIHVEEKITNASGREYWLQSYKKVIRLSDGSRVLIGFAVDFTNEIHAKREQEKALVLAQEANLGKSRFFASVSHELRTPLNAVIGFSELLLSPDCDEKESRKNLAAIHSAGTILLELVNDILDLSKLESQRLEMHVESVDLIRLADEVIFSFKPAAARCNTELKLVVDADFPARVEADPLRIRQIFFNLIGNAIKFTASGEVKVTLRSGRSGAPAGKFNLEFAVEDTGCGMSQEAQRRIFEPFVQAENQKSGNRSDRSVRGTGLGLSIVKRMVEQLGGAIFVESAPGRGSSFVVRLPEVSEGIRTEISMDAPKPKETAALDAVARDLRILIADDVPMNLQVLQAMLKRLGVTKVVSVESGAEVINVLTEDPRFDLILADWWMPEMTGLDLARRVRQTPKWSRIPVIAVTADADSHEDEERKAFADILLKPMTLESLAACLNRFLQHRY